MGEIEKILSNWEGGRPDHTSRETLGAETKFT